MKELPASTIQVSKDSCLDYKEEVSGKQPVESF